MAFDLQARLLRVLETGEYIKIGDTKRTQVDVRIISATNRHLKEEIEKVIKIFKDSDKELHNRCETEFEALQTNYGYLFE